MSRKWTRRQPPKPPPEPEPLELVQPKRSETVFDDEIPIEVHVTSPLPGWARCPECGAMLELRKPEEEP